MSEPIRRVKLVLLMIELIMTLGVPAPRRLGAWLERRRVRRQQLVRRRALPPTQQALEVLLERNPFLMETWRRSTTITRKASFR